MKDEQNTAQFLGAFEKLWKENIKFVMPVCLSVRPLARPPARMEQLSSYWTSFHDLWYFVIFRTHVERI